MSDTGHETEMKLVGTPATLRRLAAHPLFAAAGAGRRERLHAVYFDTPEFSLWHSGHALRIRREGAHYVQAVKGGTPASGGLHERLEIEAPVSGMSVDPAMFDDPRLRDVFTAELVGRLEPAYETHIVREARLLDADGGTRIEAAIDHGSIHCDGKRFPVCEVELELKSGSRAALFDLAHDLVTRYPLRLENRSKAERGIALARGEPSMPRKARPVHLRGDMSTGEAYGVVLRAALAHLQDNEAGVAPGADPEYVHQMRVALRRLRAACGLFRAIIPAAVLEAHTRELRWLARTLGPAREWDVFMTETLPPVIGAFASSHAFDALMPAFETMRKQANQRARRAVRSRRYQLMVLDLARWVSGGAGVVLLAGDAADAAAAPVGEFAERMIARRFRKARKRDRQLDTCPIEALHEFRIAVKKLRYIYDFFKEIDSVEGAADMLSALTRVQDITGAVNDAETVAHLLDDARRLTSIKNDGEAAGILLGWSRGRAHAMRTQLRRQWKAVRRLKRR